MLTTIIGWWNIAKQWWWVAMILGVIAAYFTIRKDGENAVLAEQAKARAELGNKYARIDADRPDFDTAVSDLQQRASGKRK